LQKWVTSRNGIRYVGGKKEKEREREKSGRDDAKWNCL